MKTKILTITLLLTMLFSAIGINEVSAQEPECRDAAGAVIPCPPTEPPTGGGSDSDSGDTPVAETKIRQLRLPHLLAPLYRLPLQRIQIRQEKRNGLELVREKLPQIPPPALLNLRTAVPP